MKKINQQKTIKAIDLFCGVGGLTHGLIKSGIPVVAGIDVDETCSYAFEKNNNSVFLNKDIRELSGRKVNELYGKTDIKILVGCAPCQCFSKHTQKNKYRNKDKKWKLLYSFLDLIKTVKPHIISMENVVQIEKRKVFKDFVKGIESLGYNLSWERIYCPDYGVPQDRRRLVLLASKFGEIKIIPETHDPTCYKTVRDTIGHIEPIQSGETSAKDSLHKSSLLSPINKKRVRQSKPGGTWLDWDKNLRVPCHKKKSGETYSAVYGRMQWDKPAPTITTQFFSYGTGRFGHPQQNRALSLREGALLQTFPKYYEFEDSNKPTPLRQLGVHIGNAVPVRLGTIIGRSILKHLEEIKNNCS
jgi:DNA (cytosine-5)-methyltransferase 1